MTDAVPLLAGAQAVDIGLLDALLRGAVSAAAVAALLLTARRWGRDLAGLLAGLPTVTGPAMVWLALDRGSGFASQAAHGAVAAAVPCALFALTYACLAQTHGRLAAVTSASAACLLTLLVLPGWSAPLPLGLAMAALTCLACLGRMPQARRLARKPAPATAGAPGAAAPALRAGAITVLVSGAVSALACLLAQTVGPLWAGALTSPPLLAAAVVLELHRQGSPSRVQDFLRGYTAGLVSRSIFVAVFGALLLPHGLSWALGAAVGVVLLLGGGTLVWMRWQARPAVSCGAAS